MEEIYMPTKEPFVTDEINFGDYFHAYSDELKNYVNFCCKSVCNKKSLLRRLLNIDEDSYGDIRRRCNLLGFKPKLKNDELIIPVDGFRPDFNCYKIPPDITSLATLNALRKHSNKEKISQTKKLKYVGEKDLEEKLWRHEQEKMGEDMYTYREFLLTVRVYLPAKHRGFNHEADRSQRLKPLHISQEFLIPGGITLDALRDRIICQNDFQSIEGDVSDYPWTETTIRTMDVFKSAMFYIGNTFYIDKRYTSCKDYSTPIFEWGKKRGIKFGDVMKMEDTYICQLNLRLGYPYIYVHLSNCEHIIIFTDARLLHDKDIHIYSLYPVMKSYANLRGRYCKICKRRLAKYIVMDSDRLPFSKVYMCSYCTYLYNYKGYQKIGNFKIYKYVDRVALL